MCEENFEEIQWVIGRLENTYLLLKAYSDKKSAFSADFNPEDFKRCEKMLKDMAEEYTEMYIENTELILKKLRATAI